MQLCSRLAMGFIILMAGMLACGKCYAKQYHSTSWVPNPWTAVRVEKNGKQVNIWGREYLFSQGPFPSMMSSAGKPVLAGAIQLILDEGDQNITWQTVNVEKLSASEVILRATGHSPGLDWRAKVEIAYDGLIWFTLTARSTQGSVAIRGLSLKIPMLRDITRLYSHQLVSTAAFGTGWRRYFAGNPGGLWNAGVTPAEGWNGEFTPQLWLGNYQRGLAFLAESPRHWSVGLDQKIMHIILSKNHFSGMRIDFVREPRKISKVWKIQFGLMANPVHPPEHNLNAARIMDTGGGTLVEHIRDYAPKNFGASRLNGMAKDGVKVVLLWNNWSNLWGFPGISDPRYEVFLHRFVEYAHRLHMKVIVYLGALLQLPSNLPDFNRVSKQFLLSKRDLRRNPFIRGVVNYRVIPTPAFDSWYEGKLTEFVKTYHVDGVYLDTFASPDIPLEKRDVVYAWRNWRDFYERIYRVFHGGVMNNGIVLFHDSEPNIFMFDGFADARWSGEMQYYAQAARGEYFSKVPSLSGRMPPQRFFAWTSGLPLGDIPSYTITKSPLAKRYSVGQGLIRSSVPAGDLMRPDDFFALGGLFGDYPIVMPGWFNHDLGGYYSRLLQFWSLDDRMRAIHATWIPIWKSSRYVSLSSTGNMAVSGYLAPGKAALFQVTNLVARARNVEVRLLQPSGFGGTQPIIAEELTGVGSTVKRSKTTFRVHLGDNGYVRFLLVPPSATGNAKAENIHPDRR